VFPRLTTRFRSLIVEMLNGHYLRMTVKATSTYPLFQPLLRPHSGDFQVADSYLL
jgi:hypothetical protein